jgi:acyl-CoA synthetase (AMP-forming)/AMP-acid ligase II
MVEPPSLRDYVARIPEPRVLCDPVQSVTFTALARGTSLGGELSSLTGRSVLLATESQLTTALTLIELDGRARRLTILPPETASAHLPDLIAGAEIDAVVVDRGSPQSAAFDVPLRVMCTPAIAPMPQASQASRPSAHHIATEWVLLTSGTTGVPKMVVHTLATLTAPIAAASPADGAAVWGTFYDIRRYGGLQIFLRAMLGGASLVLSHAGEPVAEHLVRLARHGVTHLSGTPSHWRRALMSPVIATIAPGYVRLSGEIADQAALDALRAAFPGANIGHAYATTEAGVAFDVNDGLAGFSAAFVGAIRDGVEMKIVDGSLRIRSPRIALRYIGDQPLNDGAGFVDTKDIIEQRGERCYFSGREDGIINVGGLKIHPEEIEAVVNQHPKVRLSLARPQPSPVLGAVVVADVVLRDAGHPPAGLELDQLKDDILKLCRASLPRHKVPATINVVPSLAFTAAGKLARRERSKDRTHSER